MASRLCEFAATSPSESSQHRTVQPRPAQFAKDVITPFLIARRRWEVATLIDDGLSGILSACQHRKAVASNARVADLNELASCW